MDWMNWVCCDCLLGGGAQVDVPGPKSKRSVDLRKSDYELFCDHLHEIELDTCVDVSC